MTPVLNQVETSRAPMTGARQAPSRMVVVSALVCAALACAGGPSQAAPATATAPVSAAPVAPSSVAAASTCLLVPSMDVNVGTPADGVLEAVNADRGDVVQAGQLLARLNAGVEAAAVATVEARLQFGQRKVQRNEDLYRKQLISSQEVDELETERELANRELRERREQLRMRSIVSPIRGVVVERFRNRGDLVRQEKIFRIVQLDPLYVETVVPGDLFGRMKLGQSVQVQLPVIKQSVQAKVTTVDRVIDPASGTFRVRLTLPNPRNEIPSGLRCQVTF